MNNNQNLNNDPQKAGDQPALTIEIKGRDFKNYENIPNRYTCDGKDINPELIFANVPVPAKSLVLIIDDPDAPSGSYDHWILYNMPANITKLEEDTVPEGAKQGKNSAGGEKYIGPCPPTGTHHYRFKLYAIDTILDFKTPPDKAEILGKMDGHIIGRGEMTVSYERQI